jgi:hypothetical protein
MKNAKKRILSVTIKRMVDESPDTSWLGEYANRPDSEFSIDRAHSEDCASIDPRNDEGTEWLERIEAHIDSTENGQDFYTEEEEKTIQTLRDCEEAMECDCHGGGMGRNEFRYFNSSFNYVNKAGEPTDGLTPEDVRKYVRQDYERMEGLNAGDWCFMGIRAEAQVQTGSDVVQRITSGGLWGVESDSDHAYITSVEKEELSALRTELKALGFSSRANRTAFETIKHEND